MVVTLATLLRPVTGGKALRVSFGTMLPVLSEDSGAYTVAINGTAALLDRSAASDQTLPATGASIVATARSFLGLKYLWGGTSGFGYDCSGFVYSTFKAHGILLPRDADPQSRVGQAVSRSYLQPGDLIFFSSQGVAYHVVIYAGQGLVIDSPSPGYPVEEVPLVSLPVIGDYSGARRVLSLAGAEQLPLIDHEIARASRNAAVAAMPPMTTVWAALTSGRAPLNPPLT
jgi:gamma-D-glutamyl-L-lysine dipeptidyl-peptidase